MSAGLSGLAAGRTVSIIRPNLPLGPVSAIPPGSLATRGAGHVSLWENEAANASKTVFRTTAATKYFFAFIVFPFTHKATFRGRKYHRGMRYLLSDQSL